MSIHFLHPYFTTAFITLILMGYYNLYNREFIKDKNIWWIISFLIVLSGFRAGGIDDLAYSHMYRDFDSLSFSKEDMENNTYGIEWLYVLYNKIISSTGAPFYIYVIITAIISISTKYSFFEKNSAYPVLGWLIYMMPTYFVGDIGQIRQALAVSIILFSFSAVKQRKLWIFLLLIYIAKGFHNSAIIFILAYWLVLLPLNRVLIIALVVTCMILSPFKVYETIPILNSILPEEVMQGFENYDSIVDEDNSRIKLMDLVSLFYLYFVTTYNNEASQKVPYYEYMRNLTIVGICLYFIFRSSPIFSTRLVSYYIMFGTITIPNIISSINNFNLRKTLYSISILFVIFYYFVFASLQGKRAFSSTTYSNWLIGG